MTGHCGEIWQVYAASYRQEEVPSARRFDSGAVRLCHSKENQIGA